MGDLEQFGEWIRDSCSVTLAFFNSNLLPYKDWKQNAKISNTAFILLLDGLGTKRIFPRTTYLCILYG